MRTLILLALLLCPAWAWGATYYVSQSGNASAPTTPVAATCWDQSDFNGAAATLEPGDTIYFLGAITTTITVPESGTDGLPYTIRGDYPGQECTITVAASDGIRINRKSYITIDGFTITGCGSAGVLARNNENTASVSDIIIQNVTSTNNDNQGIYVRCNESNQYTYNNVQILNCSTSGNDAAGIVVSGNMDNILIDNCSSSADADGGASSGWGIRTVGEQTSVPKCTVDCGGAGSNWAQTAGDVYEMDDLTFTITDVMADGESYGWFTEESALVDVDAAGEFFYDAGADKVYVHMDGDDPDTVAMYLIHYWISDVTISDCTVTGTLDNASSDGTGIGADTGTDTIVMARNKSYSNLGQGFLSRNAKAVTLQNNVAWDNTKDGYRYTRTTSGGVYNNTEYGSGENGYGFTDQTTCTINNNISKDATEYSFSEANNASGTLTNDYNCANGGGDGTFEGMSGGANKVEADPLLVNAGGTSIEDYHLRASSPCIDAGTLTYVANDDCSADNVADWTPDSGAVVFDTDHYEFEPDQATRKATVSASLVEGRTYKLSAAFKGDAAGDQANLILGAQAIGYTVVGTGSYTTLSGTLVSTATGTVAVGVLCITGVNNMNFKNFTVQDLDAIDYYGRSRLIGGGVDIGAVEHRYTRSWWRRMMRMFRR